ncbi:MAG: hypothetical protein SGJ11_06210 [Phycisphaerae bacterium]|nr:hypothetical protein [Phycisphaerae bacterium]
MKKLVRIVVVLLVLVVVAAVGVFVYVDQIAKGAIERAGTRVLGVETKLDSVSIGLLSGSATLGGLHIANPEGCKGPEFLLLKKGDIGVTPSSLLADVVHIPKMAFDGLGLDFEQRIGGDSNVDVILANAKKFVGTDGGKSASTSSKKFVIDTLELNNVVVTARTTGMPIADRGIVINVPKIVLSDIGSAGSDPVGLEQLSAMVVEAVLKAVMEASQGQLPDIFMQSIANGVRDLGGLFNGKIAVDIGKGLETVGGELGKTLEKGVNDLGKGIEKGVGDAIDGLFKKKE